MLDGKRGVWDGTEGYWQGKTRDPHTLKQLSKSKYIKVCQYSDTGLLLQIWTGAKEAAIKVFGDYEVINDSGKTALYHALKANGMKGRFKMGFYWFREADLINSFGNVPAKINIDKMIAAVKELKKQSHVRAEYSSRYTVIQYNKNGEEIQKFDNTHHCAFELKIDVGIVQKFCRGVRYNNNYILKYGEKKPQKTDLNYGNYKRKYKPDNTPKPSKAKPVEHTRTYFTVNQYENGLVVETFNSVREAALHFGLKESTVRRLCRGKTILNNNYPVLKLGGKVRVVI
jgi:hypothetical protein